MATQIEKIEEYQEKLKSIKVRLTKYGNLFNADDTQEKEQLSQMAKMITQVEKKLAVIKEKPEHRAKDKKETESIDGDVPKGDKFKGAKEIDVTTVKKITKLFEEGKIDEYGDGISHDDVDQNWVGDCYFLSALAAVAKSKPSAIEKLITGPKKDGSYDVKLYQKGGFLWFKSLKPEIVNVHPKTLEKDGQTTVGLGDRELWVLLVERAFAKQNGGYDKIWGGDSEKALEAITGKEASTKYVKDLDDKELVAFVEKAIKDNKAITTATFCVGDGNKKIVSAGTLNLHMCHEYYIMSITKSTITVRNPHNNSMPGGREVTLSLSDYKKYFEDIKYID